MSSTHFAVDDGHGNRITTEPQEHEARKAAQCIANERGEPVFLYPLTDGVEVESEEIAPEAAALSDA